MLSTYEERLKSQRRRNKHPFDISSKSFSEKNTEIDWSINSGKRRY